MDISKELIINILIIGAFAFSLSGCFLLIKRKLEKIVERTSTKYNWLCEINENYQFWTDVNNRYMFSKSLKSKQQFDRFSIDNYFDEMIEVNLEAIERIIYKVNDNQVLLQAYKNEINNISTSDTTREDAKKNKIPYCIFGNIEEMLCAKIEIKPVVSPSFTGKVSYTSPQGRNHYEKETTYAIKDLIMHYDIVINKMYIRETKEFQRKQMTASLRYDIMKRDGFKCVLCGSTVQDGVKLHVDHIVPIAKGGKTIEANLRTLCENCNWGKSDKYDEFAEN